MNDYASIHITLETALDVKRRIGVSRETTNVDRICYLLNSDPVEVSPAKDIKALLKLANADAKRADAKGDRVRWQAISISGLTSGGSHVEGFRFWSTDSGFRARFGTRIDVEYVSREAWETAVQSVLTLICNQGLKFGNVDALKSLSDEARELFFQNVYFGTEGAQ